jgi:myo-inositol 2-dehydrogenase / D-chiro-inositol 1-dehydrogenase
MTPLRVAVVGPGGWGRQHTRIFNDRTDAELVLEINGLNGRAFIEDTVKRLTLSSTGDEMRQVWEAGYFNDLDREFHRTFDRHVDHVLEALRRGAPPPVPATAGRRALQLAYACIESFESGCRVATAPDPTT